MAFFTRGLRDAGAGVIGLGDQAADALPATARDALAHYVQVGSLAAGDQVAATVAELAARVRIDRVEWLWGPCMVVAAKRAAEVGPPANRPAPPLIVRPIDGAGSADTYRADSAADLAAILPSLR